MSLKKSDTFTKNYEVRSVLFMILWYVLFVAVMFGIFKFLQIQ